MTKPSEHFRDTIREYLEQRASADALFAASCAKEHKNLDDCITFILNYVQQSGCAGVISGRRPLAATMRRCSFVLGFMAQKRLC